MEMIFATQATWAAATDPIAELSKSLRIAGMGDKEVKACLANTAISDQVVADYRGGEALGVNSTPTLFINGEKYTGARPFDELDALFGKLTSK
jgi:protein-disulfide isomerase